MLNGRFEFRFISQINGLRRASSKTRYVTSSNARVIKRSPKSSKVPKNCLETTASSSCKVETPIIDSAVQDIESHANSNFDGELRLNEINVQMINKSIYQQLFHGDTTLSNQSQDIIRRCHQALKTHGMKTDDCPLLPDVKFKLPKLEGGDILEHFYNIGEKQSQPYRRLIESLVKNAIPSMPKYWEFKPGWHRYDSTSNKATPVPFPPEDALVFDVEVCMHAGTNPTLACAVSPTHWYGWVSDTLIDGSAKPRDSVHQGLDELIPLESNLECQGHNLSKELLKPKLVVGHNVSYDRARIKEQYWIERTGCRFIDTMSMHVCVSGVTSYQRAILKSKNKEIDPDDLEWMEISSLNSLAEVHKLYCGKAISKEARNIFVDGNLQDVKDNFQTLMVYCAGDVIATSNVLRNLYPIFMERFPHPVTMAGMLELGTAYLPVNSNWNEYINAANLTYKDVELESKFLLAKKAEKACRLMHNQQYSKDLWMWDQDWSTQQLKMKKTIIKKPKKKTAAKSDDSEVVENEMTENIISFKNAEDLNQAKDGFDNIHGSFDYKGEFTLKQILNSSNTKLKSNAESDSGTNILDDFYLVDNMPDPLEKKFAYLFNEAHHLPLKRPLLPGYPAWFRKMCTKADSDENWVPGPQGIGTGMQVTPKLLSLTWEGYPLHFIRGEGWGFIVPFMKERPDDGDDSLVPFENLIQSCPVLECENLEANETQSKGVLGHLWKDVELEIGKRDYYARKKQDKTGGAYTGTGVWSGVVLAGCCYFMKLAHKDGAGKRVGNPLAKDFINKFSENVLAGAGMEAEKVLTAARMLSYWRNNRDRITQQKVMWLDERDLPHHMVSPWARKYGAILPQVVVCGTLTRRAMEPTWMTASNAHKERIGSELRAMIQSPPGYHFVGADVDSQELWIAAVLGDSQFGLHGATPFGWMTLAGSKAAGTDMHSHTAKTANVTRDHAKVINYARIYGAGQNFAERLLKQFNPAMSDGDAKSKATKMFTTTKGRRYYRLKPEYIERVFGDELFAESSSYQAGDGNDKINTSHPTVMVSFQAMKVAKLNGMTLDDMFEKPKWAGGTESDMFNMLEEIAGSDEPKTPFLGCRLTRALMTDDLKKKHLPTAVNWVVQSGAVDFLHLMLVSMAWMTNTKARFCLSFHDEVRYLVPEDNKYQVALALHVTNLYTRAFCAKKLGFNDLPRSVAYFSSVDIDTSLRKEANLDCVTPSNPHGLATGYGISKGESLDIEQTLQKCGDKQLDDLIPDK